MITDSVAIVFVTAACFLGHVGADAASKRLILHGDDDLLQAFTMLQAKVGVLEQELSTLKSTMSPSSSVGSTYIRWGRTSCPGNGSDLMYHGYMAGGKWDEYGGGSNSLCLPSDPTWRKFVDGYNTEGSIYGTEIEETGSVASAIFGKGVYNQDVPCAVCKSPRASQLMIPGRSSCYADWTEEFVGYVVTTRPSWHESMNYLCLDEGLEFLPHGGGDDEQHVITVVEARCGSLACPPYVEGRELACVVCTQ